MSKLLEWGQKLESSRQQYQSIEAAEVWVKRVPIFYNPDREAMSVNMLRLCYMVWTMHDDKLIEIESPGSSTFGSIDYDATMAYYRRSNYLKSICTQAEHEEWRVYQNRSSDRWAELGTELSKIALGVAAVVGVVELGVALTVAAPVVEEGTLAGITLTESGLPLTQVPALTLLEGGVPVTSLPAYLTEGLEVVGTIVQGGVVKEISSQVDGIFNPKKPINIESPVTQAPNIFQANAQLIIIVLGLAFGFLI